MAEPNGYFIPCYHYQQGMTFPHNQDICDHVPDIEGSSSLFSNNFQEEFSESSFQNFNHGQYYNNYVFNSGTVPSMEMYELTPSKKISERSDICEPIQKIYQEISQECEHFLLRESCNKCQNEQINSLPEILFDKPEIESDDEIKKLALSMKRKREQNKKAAARYREKKKEILTKTFTEIEELERHQSELNSTIESLRQEILRSRKILGLSLC
ncbi:hypothetical protein FO519_004049 [Halicephalobus sp. NKZ332]|nr:hypothetical protein FO519_004049 [Halicephalobus sp. NKZ332]